MTANAPPSNDVLLDEFFRAIEHGDIDAVSPMYADDVAVWHNVTQRALDKAASLDLLRYWTAHVRSLGYEILERRHFDGGAVQRHIVRGEVVRGDAGGSAIAAQVCIVFHFADGKITHIFEYLDADAVAAVFGRTES